MQIIDAGGEIAPHPVGEATGSLSSHIRWGSLVALLVAELLALSWRFDSASFSEHDGWWPWLMGRWIPGTPMPVQEYLPFCWKVRIYTLEANLLLLMPGLLPGTELPNLIPLAGL